MASARRPSKPGGSLLKLYFMIGLPTETPRTWRPSRADPAGYEGWPRDPPPAERQPLQFYPQGPHPVSVGAPGRPHREPGPAARSEKPPETAGKVDLNGTPPPRAGWRASFPGVTGVWPRCSWPPTAGAAAWTPGANTCAWSPGARPFRGRGGPGELPPQPGRGRAPALGPPGGRGEPEFPSGRAGPGLPGAGNPGLPPAGCQDCGRCDEDQLVLRLGPGSPAGRGRRPAPAPTRRRPGTAWCSPRWRRPAGWATWNWWTPSTAACAAPGCPWPSWATIPCPGSPFTGPCPWGWRAWRNHGRGPGRRSGPW